MIARHVVDARPAAPAHRSPAPDSSPERPLPQYPIESVDRTLQLVELLGQQDEVRLSQVRDRLGVGQSTAHRLMAMLVYRGFATQDPRSRAYRAGPALLRLGRTSAHEHDIVRLARPALQWLAASSGETAHLAVLADAEVHYLDVVETEALLRVTGRVGQFGPAHATSVGKAMLAALDDGDIVRRLGGRTLPQVTSRTVAGQAQLLADIRRTRSRGWSRNREEMQEGVCSVGVALVHPAHGLLGGFSLATPKARSSPVVEREHAALLSVAAARVVSAVT